MQKFLMFLIGLLLLNSGIFAQETKTDNKKFSTTGTEKIEAPTAFGDKVIIKDGTSPLVEIVNEGGTGSIFLPNAGGLSTTDKANKLYNSAGNLYWGSTPLKNGGWTSVTGKIYTTAITNKVGIGTTTPLSMLSVGGNGGQFSTIYAEDNGTYGTGVYGRSDGQYGTGVHGRSDGTFGYGVYGESSTSTGWAGYFNGDLNVTGLLYKSGGSFKIDHPLDPTNKILYHSFVESPDMMNIYNGNISTNQNGDADIELPEWFGALNKDFRYQLTVIGEFAQAIVSEEISNNQFSIRTDKPNVKVSWQVTGIRQDAYANKNRIPVEEMKNDKERGKYLSPESFNMPASMGVDYDKRFDKEEVKFTN